jgi:hypothetical protein
VLLPIRLLFILASLSLATAIARLGLWGLTEQQLEAQPFTGWRLYGRKVTHSNWCTTTNVICIHP